MTDSDTNMEKLIALSERLIGPELMVRLVDSLPDALIVVDENRRIVLVNAQAELLFGYHRSELLGDSIETLVPEPLRERHVQHIEGYVADPRTRPMGGHLSLRALHKSGREIPVQINLSPLQAPEGLFVSAVIRRKVAEGE